jgi:hypothetical protein
MLAFFSTTVLTIIRSRQAKCAYFFRCLPRTPTVLMVVDLMPIMDWSSVNVSVLYSHILFSRP